MNYLIFIIIVLLLFYGFHLYRYAQSNYEKFEYYLNCKTSYSMAWCMMLFDLLIKLAAIVGFVYLGGELISYLSNLK